MISNRRTGEEVRYAVSVILSIKTVLHGIVIVVVVVVGGVLGIVTIGSSVIGGGGFVD